VRWQQATLDQRLQVCDPQTSLQFFHRAAAAQFAQGA
jgi:hypothetical protein